MMTERRTMSTTLSSKIIEFLRQAGYSQARIARMLAVSEPYISLVRSRERSLTLDHVERLSDVLAIPIGALFIAAAGPTARGKTRRNSTFLKLMELCDEARDAILRDQTPRRRKAG